MGHHKKHHHRKMHGFLNRKKHHVTSSSSGTSSSNSEEILVKSLGNIKIEESAEPPTFNSDFYKWTLNLKKFKHLKLKKIHKQVKKYKHYMIKKILLMDAISPEWNLKWLLGAEPFRDNRYRRQAFSLPPPEINPGPKCIIGSGPSISEDAAERLLQNRFGELSSYEIQSYVEPESSRCRFRLGSNLYFFMQTVIEQMKKFNPQLMAEAQLKIMETLKMLELSEATETSTSAGNSFAKKGLQQGISPE